MSSNDRRGGNFSRDFSSKERKNNKRGSSASMRWKKGNKSEWNQSDHKKDSPYRRDTEKVNFDRGNQKKRNFDNARDSSASNKASFNSKRAWRSINSEETQNRSSSNKRQPNLVQSRRFTSFSRNNQNDFSQSTQEIEKPKQNFVFESESNDIFWGRHSTQAILESGRAIHRIWCTSEIRSSPRFFQLLKDAKALGVLVEEVSWARLGHVTTGGVHQGIALQTAASETFDLKTLIEGCQSIDESPVLIALDGLTDPQNLGAIVRSAEALGAHGLILPQRRSAGLTGSVAKVAAGALEHLPVARVVNLNRSLEELKKSGYTIIGLAGEGDKTINEITFDGPLVLAIGSEEKGLSLLTRRHCDFLVKIPLRGVTTSLNASVATSVVLYEVARQGWMKGIAGQDPSPKLVRAKLETKPFQTN
ncbi:MULTISPECIES: 23S rRNA (guanosine(2251)-2'-O)-methyltransferase RlmB [Prochlorococcus]|uniref:rRNA methylase n=1 Tax=Prochlorococcus marinus (strain SARG / CCMP1375 / SS120) TaxID=167539 RepID=Q7VCJ2_PROMA|nr:MULTISPECIES: 23S rRNA (guanosine(2251)-2'-O)-methyltransferase RlmB [Prochlorococcus]AAP99792.1 rRNA methylase [Prochlorococcus marinus subsp. marinus str. CCMP1375]KGG11863.1 23S rRNA (guanosine-2'-O-) -methyltransferase rlmB LSU rRNA Gm2251 [Prochlorococcus marinus str. LG]KGG21830.1 23S rRNA (guanosine-2'-O-) -methyltransferase rlmB LSU rRNA Gm2251 [Prochlorococcus marinus str. SS2]KGG23739.1 23S rRNA (guanosine-2'-O-) -methyltransferase rlmB LSU rRNA Gm2251 [Prochlorococcus marinus str.